MAKKRRKASPKKRVRRKRTDKESVRIKRLAIGLLILAFLGAALTFAYFKYWKTEPNKFDSDKYVVRGIDVSHHQPVLDWSVVAGKNNITFAYIKATEGLTHTDRNYAENYVGAQKAGVLIGAYHFYTFGVSGKEQAKHFIKHAKSGSGDLIPVIDVEHSKSNPHSKDSTFNASVKNELKHLEMALYEHYGVRPMIYTNKECYKLYVKDVLPNNYIWICDLHREPGDDIKNWRIWQFSHTGKLSGVGEKIDLNYYRYSFREFRELLLP
ncbi:glycoside hydrolase family 25 protein [Dysgonomonas sp. 25]|uniref:glycoside hydrolase family 25 protein n=1 Tax=Dysgonomonas sp. 25 TaxID=2302933 RepID=UPI0013D6555F|nr:GH25 family lysozyme [Dysgonomonas sp. 25]NDV67452.1 hypothetical protein [Dysgonomonas sp. 25]